MAVQVEVYSSPFCPYCYRAKKLLETKKAIVVEYDVIADPAKRDEMVRRSGGRQTVPQIFIDGKHVGGCDDIYALDSKGMLDPLLAGQPN